MKRIMILSLVLAGSVVLGSHAQGFSGEQITLNGTIQLAEGQLPTLNADGQTYSLRINRHLASEIEVTQGAHVAVTGYLREQRSMDLLSQDTWVVVRSIEIDGTRYVSADHMNDHRAQYRSDRMRSGGPVHRDDRSGRDRRSPGGRR